VALPDPSVAFDSGSADQKSATPDEMFGLLRLVNHYG
jgi:hypothetical protein